MGLLQSNATVQNGVASLIGAAASFIPYTKNVTNVGATGVAMVIVPTENGVPLPQTKPLVITKFADDKAPIQIEDATVREAETTTGGKVMSWGVVPRVKVVVSVIPCTSDDALLGSLPWSTSSEFNIDIYQVRQSAPAAPISAFGLGGPEAKTYGISFLSGTFLSGPPSGATGQPQGSADTNAKWAGHSYTFLFTKWKMIEDKAEAPGFWSSLGQTIGIG